MSLRQYEQVLARAAFLDRTIRSHAWKQFGERLERVGDFLDGVRELRIVGEDTDLKLGVEGRTWIRSKGLRNFPDGEVFTGPHETSVEGTIRFTFPAMMRGRQADDVRLRFEGGEVVEATAKRGQDFLREMVGMDDGARRVGESAFGLNEAISEYTGNLLLDEKIGGTVDFALGLSVPGTGGDERVGAALGHGVRPARGRRGVRGRRARLPRRRLPQRRQLRKLTPACELSREAALSGATPLPQQRPYLWI